jgi:thiol-disulfide isomerase/thioredoxin
MVPPPPGESYDNIPKNLLDSINTFDFNNDRHFHKTRLYPKTVLQYVQLYLRWKGKIKNDDLPGIYNIAKTTLNSQIKDFVISQLLNSYTKRNNIYFDSLLNDFKLYSRDTNSIFYLDSVRNILKGNSDEQFLKVLKTNVENDTGSSIILEDIFENKPIIIDCWASWCKPCLDEEPYMKELMKEYQDKVQFIFLSFDRVKESWISKSKELNLGKYNYILPTAFDNYFSYFFNIAAIPRYIIFDKKRNIIYKDSPRPSEQKELKKIFDKLLE